jgi:hypothetical protein
MSKLYKLTDQNWETMNCTKWGPHVTHKTDGSGELCSRGWLHAYTSPELAVLLNPIHANIENPVLWLCEGKIEKSDSGLKVGTTRLTTIRRIDIPQVSTTQRVIFGILCSLQTCENSSFSEWAAKYLNGTDRSEAAARSAAKAAAEAARSAAEAAWAAARSAAWSAWSARSAAWSAWSARSAAWAAAWAAAKAGKSNIPLEILAEKALTYVD